MPLVGSNLDLAPCQEDVAFREIDAILRADPVLSSVFGKHIYSWTGNQLDDADPTQGMLPWMRITPSPGPSSWETEGQHRMPMTIGIELAVAGTDVSQLLRLWAAVRLALFPRDLDRMQAIRERTNAAKITRGTFTAPVYGAKKLTEGFKALVAAGMLEILLLVET